MKRIMREKTMELVLLRRMNQVTPVWKCDRPQEKM